MKILNYILVFIVLTLPALASDANVYYTEDFTEHPAQAVIMTERDIVKIAWEGNEHQLMVRKIYEDKDKVDVTAFVKGAEVPYYLTLNPKIAMVLDFDHDLKDDLKVSIFNLVREENVVALKFEKINKEEPIQIPTTDAILTEPTDNKPEIKKEYLLFAGIILLGLFVWNRRLFLKSYRKIKKRK